MKLQEWMLYLFVSDLINLFKSLVVKFGLAAS